MQKKKDTDISYFESEEKNSPVISIISGDFDDVETELDSKELASEIPVLALRNTIVFPGTSIPITVARSKSLKLVKQVGKKRQLVGLVCQRNPDVEDPLFDDLYHIGVIGELIKVVELSNDDNITVIVQGKQRFELTSITQTDPYLKGTYKLLHSIPANENDQEYTILMDTIRDQVFRMIRMFGEPQRDLVNRIKSANNLSFIMNYCCTNLAIPSEEKQELLSLENEKDRAYRLLVILNREVQLLELKMNIQMRTREEINQQQKEYFLQQQIKAIQDELGSAGGVDNDVEELQKKAQKKHWSEAVAKTFDKELQKLERLHPQSPDYSTQLVYLQTILDLPWNEYTKDNFQLKHAQKVLNQDHFGLETVKERILEYLSVLKLKGDLKSPIICLYGPPGVGKTSLGKSIAKALNRKYVRVSFGGLHDESEIRGHRRTYIGAMPGRIIQNIIKAGSSNPVFVLDEIDKISSDYKGDPASALLEVLDPEQNSAFHDNYLNIDYDLSKVLFIATANNISNISQPLLDRMELIDVSGYITEEKIEIAHKHLVPKELAEHGIEKKQFDIPKKTLEKIIESYTRESGVRMLDKKIAKIMRKVAYKIATESPFPKSLPISKLPEYLGPQEYSRDKYQGNEHAGVAIGLAWTAVGGEILFIESSLSKGNGSLSLTGNLGNVMKESATIALKYLHAHSRLIDIDEVLFRQWNVHIHVPEGAIPKDGPSAGITMVTSLASAFTQRKVRNNLSMTGEITLRGKVLPVGGIKEKILAAKRAGITDIILCRENQKDVEKINEIYRSGLIFHYVNHIDEVLKIALLDEKVKNPIDIAPYEEKTSKKQ